MFEEILQNESAREDYVKFNSETFASLKEAVKSNNSELISVHTNKLVAGNELMLHNISRKIQQSAGGKLEYDDVFSNCVICFMEAVQSEATKEGDFGGRIFSITENALKEAVFYENASVSMSYQTHKKYKRQAYAAASINDEFNQEVFDEINSSKTVEVQGFDDEVNGSMLTSSTEDEVLATESRMQLLSICDQIFNGVLLTEIEEQVVKSVILENKSMLAISKEVGLTDKTVKKIYERTCKKIANAAKRIDPAVQELLAS